MKKATKKAMTKAEKERRVKHLHQLDAVCNEDLNYLIDIVADYMCAMYYRLNVLDFPKLEVLLESWGVTLTQELKARIKHLKNNP